MKISIASLILLISAFCSIGYSADGERDLWQLRKIALAIEIYMEANNGQVPSNLEPLSEYIDVAKMLGAAPGSKLELTERYSLLSAKPTINLPGKGSVQIVLLGVRTEEDRRMAIWIGKDGLPETGLLKESELAAAASSALNLQRLKPMGGVVPKTSERVLAAANNSGMTEYQAKVLALAREGKIKSDPPYRPETTEGLPLPQNTPRTIAFPAPSPPRQAPTTPPQEAVHVESPSPSFPIIQLAALIVVIAGVVVFIMLRKTP